MQTLEYFIPVDLGPIVPRPRRRKKGQRCMCSFHVFHKDEPHHGRTVSAKTASEARYDYFLDVRDPWPDVRYIDIRSRFIGVDFIIGEKVPAEERKKLEVLRHALGLKDYIGEGTPYRNYFASGPGSTDWDVLVELCSGTLPLMGRRDADHIAKDMVYFHVTIAGKEWVDKRLGMSTDPRN